MARMHHYYKAFTRVGHPTKTQRPPEDWLAEAEIYISTEGDDRELASVINQLGDDYVMMSADMPHGDVPVDLLPSFRERQDIPAESRRKILGLNAARFYKW